MAKPDERSKYDDASVATALPAQELLLQDRLVWQRGRAVGPAQRLAGQEPSIYCFICGRPLRQGEDFGPWRHRAVRTSSLWHFEFRSTCPDHHAGKAGGASKGGLPPRREDCAA
jgi:hypothetical protein